MSPFVGFGSGLTPLGLNPTPGADNGPAINSALANLGYAYLPPGSFDFTTPISQISNGSIFSVGSGTSLNYVGANNAEIITNSTAGGPIIDTFLGGLAGKLKINCATATGCTYLGTHSLQNSEVSSITWGAMVDTSGTLLKQRCDVTSNGGYGSNRNNVYNKFHNWQFGKVGTFIDAAGAAVSSQVVTLNNYSELHGLNTGVTFLNLGAYFDNNVWYAGVRTSLTANANGVVTAADATNYANVFDVLQIDTFAGAGPGRTAITWGSGSSRQVIWFLFNNPLSETSISDGGSGSFYIGAGDYQPSGVASSSLSSFQKNVNMTSNSQSLTFPGAGGAVTVDLSRIGWFGKFSLSATDTTPFTISNPTNGSVGQIFGVDIANGSGGVMAASLGANYKVDTTAINPANGKHRTLWFAMGTTTTARQIGGMSGDTT